MRRFRTWKATIYSEGYGGAAFIICDKRADECTFRFRAVISLMRTSVSC